MKIDKDLVSTSKFPSLVLRQQPEVVGMQLDEEGWLDITELIAGANERGKDLTLGLVPARHGSLTRSTTNAPRINPVVVLTRNLLFLLIVLFHGFRRLGPPY